MASRTRALLATIPLVAVLAACGVSGGEDDAAPTGSGDGTEAPTTVTVEQLEAILPTAEDLGGDYEVDETTVGDSGDDEDEDPSDSSDEEAQMEEACPALAEVLPEDDTDEQEVTRTFSAPDDRSVEVSLDAQGVDFTEEQATELVDAINECDTVELSDEDGTATVTMSAEAEDELGDHGLRISMTSSVEVLGYEITFDLEGRIFVVDGIGVSVMVSSGFDDTTLEPVAADVELLDPLSQQLVEAIGTL